MKHGRSHFWSVIGAATLLPCVTSALSPEEEFFETKIRPLLSEHCYGCHSDGEKIKGGLRLDIRSGWEVGGDSGPAVLPGDPENSLLVRAIRYHDEDLQMPPKKQGRLSDDQIALVVEWIRSGAFDPRSGDLIINDPGEDHWAFQPISNPALPEVNRQKWIRNDIDSFILAELESKDLPPSPRADARTLIRRVYHDVIGLPPSPEAVINFEQDSSEEAYQQIVDDLLSRPQYGEKWARHWLDVARYADTKGYVFQEERSYAYAYTFRDYVIESFNNDKPYNQFIIEQLAADRLDLGDDKRPLAGMGYLTLGRRFLNNQHDIIDDRIDVVTRGMMGLTVACARCHDHKYDPIPAADYYSLYGVFASSHEPGEKPLIGIEPPGYDDYLKEHERRVKERDDFVRKTNEEIRNKLRSSVGDYILAAHEASLLKDRGARENLAKSRKLDFGVQERWAKSMEKWSAETNEIFLAWNSVRVGVTNSETIITNELATILPKTAAFIRSKISAENTTTLADIAEAYELAFREVDEAWHFTLDVTPDSTQLDDPEMEPFREILYGKDMPLDVSDGELRRMYEVRQAERSRALQREVEKLDATHEGAPPRAMVMLDKDKPYDPYVFKRGQSGNRGESVPRQFLGILSDEQEPFKNGSGRLELAEAIASTDNPLTARVIINRIWLQYFNSTLVDTPSDFGVRCDPPSHPKLLDHLAWTFMHEDGWSLKKLHRRILLSATYQQSSADNPDARAIDPDNRSYWRQNRKRLGFEAMRDSLLSAAGNIDPRVGGRSVDVTGTNYSTRRSLYAHIDRQNLPGLFRTFDLASPDTTSPKRFNTTVPQQALFLMNSPFIVGQARELASSVEAAESLDSQQAIRELYRRTVLRDPTDSELRVAEQFLKTESARPEPEKPQPVWRYGFGRINVENASVESFTEFRTFTDSQWQASRTVPDPDHGWVLLGKDGGHPGNDLDHAVIRRWTAPRDGTIVVRGEARHNSDNGDGVRMWIVPSSGSGSQHWIVANASQSTVASGLAVAQGDHVDLVVDCRTSPNHDSFSWVAKIRYEEESDTDRWDSSRQFSGPQDPTPPLRPMEKLAQVLLVSNEFFFID